MMNNKTMMTDFYELTMAQTYFDQGKKDEVAYFDIFFRSNPFNGGYTMTGGLEETIEYLQNFKFEEDDIDFLRTTGSFSEEFLAYLKDLKFTGDLYAMPDGTAAFPNEAVLTVRANMVEAQIIETALLANFNHGSLVTTKAKRVTSAAKKIPVMEFGARRARGVDSAIEASKHAYIGGCAGTSNVYAGKKYDIPVLGTMAHSLIQEETCEYEAFLAYAKSHPDNCVFLVDTFDTLKSGIPNAIRVSKEYLEPNGYKLKGIRIDSGDLVYLSKAAKQMLVDAGYPDATICLSNGLDEYSITNMLNKGAVIDSIGAGDNIAASKERVGGVYKLVAVEKDGEVIPKIKVSGDTVKTTNPGVKKVYRFYDFDNGKVLGDVIAREDEIIPENKYTLVSDKDPWKKTEITDYRVRELQVPIFKNGELVYQEPTLKEKQAYCEEEYQTLTDRITDIDDPHTYYVDLSEKMRNLKEYMLYEAMNNASQTAMENIGYQKVKTGCEKKR